MFWCVMVSGGIKKRPFIKGNKSCFVKDVCLKACRGGTRKRLKRILEFQNG